MEEPTLYGRYDRGEAIALFGPEAEARNLFGGQWVILPGVALGFAEVGGSPGMPHFRRGGEFLWVADRPYGVGDEPVSFLPPEVFGGLAGRPGGHLFVGRPPREARDIRLFVRKGGEGPHTYVGRLRSPCRFDHGGGEHHGAAYFPLTPALPSDTWAGLGGPNPGDLDHDAVDAALGRLRRPTTVGDRLGVLRQVVEYWHGPIRPEDGIPEAQLGGIALPDPLRWWYLWAGRGTGIMCGQNFLLGPERLKLKDGLLEFYVENQYCYQWGTLPEGDDPPVHGREEPSRPWEPEGMTLSEHLILACLFESIICHSPYGASTAWLDAEALARIADHIPPVAIGPWRWCGSARFHAGGGAFMVVMGDTEGGSVWVGAKTEHPLRALKHFIGEDWDYVSI